MTIMIDGVPWWLATPARMNPNVLFEIGLWLGSRMGIRHKEPETATVRQYRQEHPVQEPEPVPVEDCTQVFTPTRLRDPFRCPRCGKKFASHWYARKHCGGG